MSSEETVLLKAFKYFDLNNNGTVEPEEFAKAVEKIGIMIPTKQVSHDFQALHQTFQVDQFEFDASACQPTLNTPPKLIFIYTNLGFG